MEICTLYNNTQQHNQLQTRNNTHIQQHKLRHQHRTLYINAWVISVPKLLQVVHATTGIDIVKNHYWTCLLGKSLRESFSRMSHEPHPQHIMDMAVADLCGPIYNYYVSVIVEVTTRRVFVRIIHKKSDTTQHITQWVTRAQTQTGKTLKRFHSDGGGEYISNQLKSFFNKQGTIMTTTTTVLRITSVHFDYR